MGFLDDMLAKWIEGRMSGTMQNIGEIEQWVGNLSGQLEQFTTSWDQYWQLPTDQTGNETVREVEVEEKSQTLEEWLGR